MSEVWCKNLRETAHVLGKHPMDCFHCEAFALGLAERDERVRELEQFIRTNAALASVGESLLAASATAVAPRVFGIGPSKEIP